MNYIPRDKWVDIGYRARYSDLPMWVTFPDAPFTVSEARDFAYAKRIILMHRHEEDRVVAQAYIPSEAVRNAYMKGTKKGGKKK